jgi:hypothetical protein
MPTKSIRRVQLVGNSARVPIEWGNDNSYAIVDVEALPTLPRRPWFGEDVQRGKVRPVVEVDGERVPVAHIIMGIDGVRTGYRVSYKNGNMLDCRRRNLRIIAVKGYKGAPPPDPLVVGNTVMIPVSSVRGSADCTALVNRRDLPAVVGHKWHRVENVRGVYAATTVTRADGKRTTIYLHRLIAELIMLGANDTERVAKAADWIKYHRDDKGPMAGREVDHIKWHTLDNRRHNLRIVRCSDVQKEILSGVRDASGRLLKPLRGHP